MNRTGQASLILHKRSKKEDCLKSLPITGNSYIDKNSLIGKMK